MEGVSNVGKFDSVGFHGFGDHCEKIVVGLVSPDCDTQETVLFGHIVEIIHHFYGVLRQHQHQIGYYPIVLVRRLNRQLSVDSSKRYILPFDPLLVRNRHSGFFDKLLQPFLRHFHHTGR